MSSQNLESKRHSPDIKEIFPKVISASRATDIPAFHSEWFISQFRKGYFDWQNPFNAHQRQRINLKDTRVIVFWSKNPANLIPYLSEIADTGRNFYFQFTLNNYELEGLEPGIPPLATRIDTFSMLASKYNVIWRYDPILLGDRLTLKRHLDIVADLMSQIGHQISKMVFSFVDLYDRVNANIKRFNPEFRDLRSEEMNIFTRELVTLRDEIAPGLRLATCAEGYYSHPGIEKNSCIDPHLINAICKEEVYPAKNTLLGKSYAKDKGQRADCGCAPSKDIGSYRNHPCLHHCVYCYAGHSKK